MDYTKVPRELIYNDRTDLKNFGVQVIDTVNGQLFSNLKNLFIASDRAKELILRCFNNAYYICTLIPFEDFPETQVAEYEKLLLKDDTYNCLEVCAVSMAMVCKLLPAYDAKWRDNDLINSIQYRFTHYQWMHIEARKSFEFMMEKHNTDGFILPQDEFAPLDITEVIDTFDVRTLQIYAEYICERIARLEDSRQRMYWADIAIARIKDYKRELCKDNEYDPKKDCFKYEGNPIRDLDLEEKVRNLYQQSEKAIDYYTKHYPNVDICHPKQLTDSKNFINGDTIQVSEIANLRQQLTQLVSENRELNNDNTELKEKLAEFSEPVEELPAEDKVRMAFALQLLKTAGLTNEKLKQRGNKVKVATVMSLLTGISSNNSRGNKAQICQTFLTDQKYYPRTQNMEMLIKLNNLCAELGIDACLSLESQSNK